MLSHVCGGVHAMAITPSYSGRRPEAKSGEFLPWTARLGCIHTYHSAVNSSRLLSPQQVSYWDFESSAPLRARAPLLRGRFLGTFTLINSCNGAMNSRISVIVDINV